MPELKFNEDFVRGQMQEFYDEGEAELQKRIEDFEKAEKMYNGEFRNTVPSDSIYYSSVRNDVAQIVRDITQTYNSMEDILAVNPETEGADKMAAITANIEEKILNGKINDKSWRNRNVWLQKSALQAGIYGGAFCSVYWERQTETEPVMAEIDGFNDDGLPTKTEEEIGTTTRIVKNNPVLKRLHREELIWDSTKDEWSEIDWAMRINMKKNEREIRAMIKTQGFNEDNVDKLLENTSPDGDTVNKADGDVSRAEDNEPYKLAEFYGWMRLEEDENPEFVKIVMDMAFEYFLLEPTNGDEHIYRWIDRRPMIPYVAGYLYPKLDSIIGESLMLLGESQQKEENSLRNAIRRSAESDTHSVWGIKRGSGIDQHNLLNRQNNRIVWTNTDPSNSMQEFPHRDTTGSAHNYLDRNDRDRQKTYGNTDYKIGISDPSITDTASGIWQMTNAANSVAMAFIKSLNDTYVEPVLERVMHMSVKYVTDEELEEYGIPRDQYEFYIKKNTTRTRLTVDSEQGAVSVLAKRTMATQNYFLSQEAVMYAQKVGLVLPPESILAPFAFLKDLYETNGAKSSDLYLPDPKKIMELSQAYQKSQLQQEQQQKQQEQELVKGAMDSAMEKGSQAALEQMANPSQGTGTPNPGGG